MEELLAQFLIEGPELVQQGSDALFALERNPEDRPSLDDAFRALHTLKGSAGLFDMPPLENALHAAEDVLGIAREGRRGLSQAMLNALLATLTQTERWLAALQETEQLPADAVQTSASLVRALADPTGGQTRREAGLTAIRYRPDPKCYFRGDDPIQLMRGVPKLIELKLGLREADESGAPYDPFTCTLIIDAVSAASPDELKAAFRFVLDQIELTPLESGEAALDQAEPVAFTEQSLRTLRVETVKLEGLAALIDELVAAKNGLAGLVGAARDGADPRALTADLTAQYGLLDRLIGRVHHSVTGLRMVPVTPFLRRFPRLVREMAAPLGRDIEVIVEASAVEADKDVIERLFEPLAHLLRNSVDHGVEPAEERLAAGKPARATITLAAEAVGGRLRLKLSDDGRGIDPVKIRAAAETRGLLPAESLRDLSDQDAIELIFLPGFSTAQSVSALSGRGVGMDAVRAAVQRLGGRVALSSRPGAGTLVEMTLPLTVSLTKIIVVSDGDQQYGVPMDRVLETVRVGQAEIVPIRAGQAFNWRDRTVPLLALSTLTGRGAASDGEPRREDRRVLVIRAQDQPVGLAIDAIVGRLDVAMRPAEGLLAAMPGLAGTTMLGNGRVLVILDPEALVA